VPITCERTVEKVGLGATFLKLDNGLTLIHQEIAATSVVSVDVWVQAGSMTEPEECSGIAHFLEHMIFKGTENILPGEFDCLIELQGGVANAATSHDYAHYTFTAASDSFGCTLPYLAEMLLNASIPDDEFEQERLVVLEEMRQSHDDPDWLAFQNLMQTAYSNHPYKRSVLGSEETILSLTPDQMRRFHRSRYRPDLMTVVVVGAISTQEALDVVSSAFSGSGSFRAHCPAYVAHCPTEFSAVKSTNWPTLSSISRHQDYLPRLQHSRMTIAWMGPCVDRLEDALQLELVSTILAEGRTSRLVKELREDLGWVHDICSSFTMQKEPGLFTVGAYLDAQYLELVEHKVLAQIDRITTTPVTDLELKRAKRSLCNSFAFAVESPDRLASFLGYHGLLGCQSLCSDWSYLYASTIEKVQPQDLLKLAQKYLSPEKYAIASLVPAT
jgi:zinc protease